MNNPHGASYLRSHRKKSGLSQRDLATLVGYLREAEVSRHERLCSVPSFRVALCYEAIFRVPVSALFPAAFQPIEAEMETRLAQLGENLHESSATGREAARIAHKLEWLWERDNSQTALL